MEADQTAHEFIRRDFFALEYFQSQIFVIFRIAEVVDAGDRRDDDDVVAADQSLSSRVAQPVDFLVYLRILLYIGVGVGDICLRLVVVIVGNKIMHRILRKELLEFFIQLGGQCFIVRNDQRRPLILLDHLSHGESLTGTGHAQEYLVLFALLKSFGQLFNCLRLVASWIKF